MKRLLLILFLLGPAVSRSADTDTQTVRVFVFAGQSNMVGTHSRVEDIQRFPPSADLDKPQPKVLFSYKLGREGMATSDGWIDMQPTGDYFGPELAFARDVSQHIKAPIAIIKCASGGTGLADDWNPDEPSGFKLYPLALAHVRASLAELARKKMPYRVEGFLWHQGENDMAFGPYRREAAKWLQSTVTQSRLDLALPALKWHVTQQPPPDEDGLNAIDITAHLAAIATGDPAFYHLKAFDLSPHQEKLVITTEGIVKLGERLARSYLEHR